MNILIFIALLQIKLFSIFQIRKLSYLIFFEIYGDDSSGTIHPNFQKRGRTSFPLEILKWQWMGGIGDISILIVLLLIILLRVF